jgi:hypothetical protein
MPGAFPFAIFSKAQNALLICPDFQKRKMHV